MNSKKFNSKHNSEKEEVRIKVSVVMPVYNVEKYIKESLQSVIDQKFDDFELIIVNDGTKDRSIKIAEEVLRKFKGPFKIINQRNKGLPSARNAGLKVAQGKYISFIDSDDILDENFIRDMYEFSEKNDLKVSFCNFEKTKESSRFGVNNKQTGHEIIDINNLLKGFLTRRYKIHCCTLLIDTNYLRQKKIKFNEKLTYGEDVQFMWRLFPTLSHVGYIKAYNYKYLIREGSLMTDQNVKKILILQEEMKKTVYNLKLEHPQYIEIFNNVQNRVKFGNLHAFVHQAKDYESFQNLLQMLNYKKMAKSLMKFPDAKIIALNFILAANPRLFYKLFNDKINL